MHSAPKMSQEERTGFRDLSYSAWHRVRSIARYLSSMEARSRAIVLLADRAPRYG